MTKFLIKSKENESYCEYKFTLTFYNDASGEISEINVGERKIEY